MKSIFYLLLLFLITNAATCTRIRLPGTTWKVLEMRLPNTSSVQMPTKDYLLEFTMDNRIGIKLDINSCFSPYKVSEPNRIIISNLGCTEACCDSEFAITLADLLAQTKTFNIKGDKLQLDGAGKIKLALIP